MVTTKSACFFNAQSVFLSEIPLLDSYEFRHEIRNQVERHSRLAALFGTRQAPDLYRLFAVTANPASGQLNACSTLVGTHYQSFAALIPQTLLFEREIAEHWDLTPLDHPDPRPFRFPANVFSSSAGANQTPLSPKEEETHGRRPNEIQIGPLWAGVDDAFIGRFQVVKERIAKLDIELGFQHRGVAAALVGGPDKRTLPLIESLAGDSSVGHGMAGCQILEALSNVEIPLRPMILRGVVLELERIIRHTSDLGTLAREIAFLPAAGVCGRLAHEFCELMVTLSGNYAGRGFLRFGGTAFDIDGTLAADLQSRVLRAVSELKPAIRSLWNSSTIQERFAHCGVLPSADCEQWNLTGLTARASGHEHDVRHDFPTGIYRYHQIPVSTFGSGDVLARALVRWLEIQRSADFICQQTEILQRLKAGPTRVSPKPLREDAFAIALVEGWRGAICHVAMTDGMGRLAHYQIFDPSFHNWSALPIAVQGQLLSDFGLIRKSFNLSCGVSEL